MKSLSEKNIHTIFVVSLFFKTCIALVEIAAGVFLFFTEKVSDFLMFFISNELIEDPNDILLSHISPVIQNLSSNTSHFAAVYLLSRGLIKVFLVWGLLKDKLWAYPLSMIVLLGFIGYQILEYVHKGSLFVAFLTLFDAGILFLIWHEYQFIKNKSVIK